MRIAHIGHGRLPIPPTAHGAVEDIIWNYKFWCERFGHEFLVVNDPDPVAAMRDTHNFNPDVVHLHDERKIDEFVKLEAPAKLVTTHDPEFFEKRNPFIDRFVRGDFLVGCLSDNQRLAFEVRGVGVRRLFRCPNGARADLIRFTEAPAHPGRMICLGMIGQRKRQNLLLNIPFVDCIGHVASYDPIVTRGVMFESWTREEVCRNLTDYAALVLLSKSEAAPLVVMEALMAGLDVVVSEAAAANLDLSQPFVHVLDEKTINNALVLRLNLERILNIAKGRAAVRAYAEKRCDWQPLVKNYLSALWPICLASCRRSPDLCQSSPETPHSQTTLAQSPC